MKKTHLFLSAVLIAAVLNSCGGNGTTLVKVGRESITEKDLETLARVNPRLKPRLTNPQGKQKVLENYVEQELLFLESNKRGLNRSKDVKEKIALYEKILIAQALLDDELNKKVKEYYTTHSDEFERVKASHILIRAAGGPVDPAAKKEAKKGSKRPEAEALKMIEGIKARLQKGEDFTKLAKELSEDERTKASDGDLGYLTIHDKRLERWGWLPLGEKAFSMAPGEVSDPVRTKEGFHLIKVTEGKTTQPMEEAEGAIRFRLQSDIRTQLLDELKKKYKVEFTAAAPSVAPEGVPAMPPPPAPENPQEAAPAPAP